MRTLIQLQFPSARTAQARDANLQAVEEYEKSTIQTTTHTHTWPNGQLQLPWGQQT